MAWEIPEPPPNPLASNVIALRPIETNGHGTPKPKMELKRLRPDDPESWALMPVLEFRARDACPRISSDTPPDALCAMIRQKFAVAPITLGAWLVRHSETKRVVGHVLGWVDVSWGEPYILIHQGDADEAVLREVAEELSDEVTMWIGTLNLAYETANMAQRIRRVIFLTERPKVWERIIKARGHVPMRTLTMLSIPLDAD